MPDRWAVTGKGVVITGGTAGLGFAMAEELVRGGARVIVTGRDGARGRKAEAALTAIGPAWFVQHDIASDPSLGSVEQTARQQFARLDALINNVGVNEVKPMAETRYADFLAMVRVNLLTTWRGLRWATGLMRADGQGGAIVNIASMAARYANPAVAPYCAAKAMVAGLTRVAADEFRAEGIRVNTIYPGIFMTELTEMTAFADEAARSAQLARIPMGRFGRPSELGGLARFLVSDSGRGVTGTDFLADGGRTA